MRRDAFEWGHDQLLSLSGQRKYLCATEFRRFLDEAESEDAETRIFCRLLGLAGCRISEALELTAHSLDTEGSRVVFRTLKRRRRVYRAVPIPAALMLELSRLADAEGPEARLWPWSRQTGWRRVKAVMAKAGIAGPQATPKGLRHQFGILAAERNIPTGVAQRWMGHASPKTTAIYQQAVGAEERAFAERMWTSL